MRIVRISTEEYRWPRHKPISNGLHTYTHAGLGLVKIETDAGVTGIGLGGTGIVEQATIQRLTQELIGEDPIDVERLTNILRRQPKTADLKHEIGELREELRRAGRFGHLWGASPPMQALYDKIARVAPTAS